MNLAEYRSKFPEDSSPGWDAISSRLDEIYPGIEPAHFASVPHYALGGENPLDGVSIYKNTSEGTAHYHYVTYGFSNLYRDESAVGGDFSGYGFELTFRLKPYASDPENPAWAMNMLQNLAKYVFKSGNIFDDFHWLDAKGPIRLNTETKIIALAFITDPELGIIDTPHGKVKFLQVVGLTAVEFQSIKQQTRLPKDIIETLRKQNRLLVTDLERS